MNNIIRRLSLILILFVIFFIKSFAQTDSVFWFVAPEINNFHYWNTSVPDGTTRGEPTYFRFSNTENYPVVVRIFQPANPAFATITDTIPALETKSVKFIWKNFLAGTGVYDLNTIENLIEPSTPLLATYNHGKKGLKILATGKINAYYEYAVRYNMDIISLKGKNALGKEFYVPFQTKYPTSGSYPQVYSAIDLVATESGTTEVKIYATTDLLIQVGAGTLPGTPTQYSGPWPYIVNLTQGQTFSAVPWRPNTTAQNNTPLIRLDRTRDLHGTRIISDKKIAVSTKDDLVYDQLGAVDMVADQLVPTSLLGMEYLVMQGQVNAGYDNAYVIPIHNGTTFSVNGGAAQGPYAAGQQVKVQIDDNTHILGSDTILVYHVTGINTISNNQLGGAIIPTIDACTGSQRVSFVRTMSGAVFYLNVMVKTGGEGAFEINGNPALLTAGEFVPAPLNPGWMIARKSFTTNATTGIPEFLPNVIENVGGTLFHLAILHGSVDCFYGYFSNFNQNVASAQEASGRSSIGQVCEGDTIQLEATGGTSYQWSPADYLDDPFIAEPKAVLPAGVHDYDVHILGDCNLDTIIHIQLESLANPEAFFTLSEYNGCAPLEITMQNQSAGADIFRWDFTNNASWDLETTDSIGTVLMTYDNTSLINDTVYSIRMLAKESGVVCTDEFTNTVQVFPKIKAGFYADTLIGCNPLTVNFTDTSSGNLDQYEWIFGDGAISIANGDTMHTYNHFKTNDTVNYAVELRLTSPYFCKSTARDTISVFPYLEAGFAIDEDDGCSPLTVRIDNISSGADSIFLDYGDNESDTLLASSSTVIYHKYVNNDGVDEVDTNIIVMRSKNNAGCEEFWYDTVLVFPEIHADYIIDPYDSCNYDPDSVMFINISNDGIHTAYRYLWDFDDGSNMDTTNNTIKKFYNNTTENDKVYNFRLTARSIYGCVDDTTNSINLYRAYADFTVDNNEGCSPVVVSVNNISIGNQITNWDWDYGDALTTTSTDEDPFPFPYTNTGFENDTNKLVLEVTGTAGCTARDSIYIIVYPNPEVTFTSVLTTVSSCDSLVVDFTPILGNPLLPIDTIWNFGDGSSSSESNPQHVYKNLLGSTAKPYSVSLRVETDLGCYDEHDTIITVNPLVRSNIFVDLAEGCSPLTVNAIAQTYPGINFYNWDYGDGSTITNYNPPPYPYSPNNSYEPYPVIGGDDEYYLRLDVEGSGGDCVDSDSILITIFPEIVADFIPQGVIDCNPFEVTFTDRSTVNVDSWYWNFGDGTSSSLQDTTHTFINNLAGTQPFNVSLDVVSDQGCTDNTIAQISVLPPVVADFDIDISEYCSPLPLTVTNNSSTGPIYSYKWYWDNNSIVPDSTIETSFFKEFFNSTGVDSTYTIKLVVDNGLGCKDSISRDITVFSSLVAGFTFSQPDSCTDSDVAFTDITIPAVGGYNYSWDFNDGSYSTTTASSFIKTFSNGKTTDYDYHVGLTVESPNGCTSFYTKDVTVYSKVVADFSIPLTAKCPPFENAVIVNNSFGDNSNTYEWYVDNSATPDQTIIGTGDFIRTYDNTDHENERPYPIRLVAYNSHGCTSEMSDVINVYEYVEADFSVDIDKDCAPLQAQFTNSSSVPPGTTYSWDFNDGASSGDIDPFHEFFNKSRTDSIIRTVSLSVQSPNFCKDNTSMQVTIYHNPLAKFFIDRTSSCPELESTLIKESLGEDLFEWRFGDLKPNNTSDANLTYKWDNTDINNIKIYNLELWVGTYHNCVDSTSLDLTVFPRVTADFKIDKAIGCSPLEDVIFTNTSSSPATQFFWTFGDGTASNLKSPSHDFINISSADRTYDVYLRASTEYDCWDDTSQQVTVYVQPDAEFYMDPKLLVFPNNVVNLTNLTNFGPFEYTWNFGDINNSSSTADQPNTFEYEHWGEKIISLDVNSTTSSNCTDTYVDTLLIMPPLVNADFTMDIEATCLNDNEEITFTAFPVFNYGDGYEYEWDFGDESGIETGKVVYHTYTSAGLYFVKLVARSTEIGREDEEDFVYKSVRIYANPIANMEVSPKISMLNSDLLARVEFFNLSECSDTSGCSYVWDFGDGSTAISKDVTHNYTEIGVYDVSLLVTTASGCKDSILLEDEVSIIGEGDIKFPNAFTPNGDGLNDTFKPVAKGVITYEMYIYNRWGELIFTTKDLDAGWNGKMNGDYAKPDVYVWKAEGKFTNGRSFELAGDITLIR